MSVRNHAEFTTTNLFNVEGWTVLVTGGGTGIGLMISQAFANNGAKVYIVGRRSDVLLKTAETWGAKLAHPKGQLIPVMVNNAGVSLETSNTDAAEEGTEALQEALWKESWDNVE